jgi:mono/diheme cytochrome c family protein
MAPVVRALRQAACLASVLAIAAPGLEAADRPVEPQRPPVLLAQKAAAKKKAAASRPSAPEAAPAAEKSASVDAELKFSRDIAPILVGNCIGCHNPKDRKGKFDLTTFEKLMAGSDKEKVIEPGKPDDSHLVLRLRGEEEPKMPQGNNNNLSDEAIAKVEKWVKAGARLDAGIDSKAQLKSYAPSVEELRSAELRKLPAGERDKMVETAAQKRWKQASPKTKPEVTSSAHFLLFSTLPKDRAGTVVKGTEAAYAQLRSILSKPGAPALDWPQKTSLFVFNDRASFVEFVRTLENREIEASETGTADFAAAEPYIAVVDPLGGHDEPAPTRKTARTRKGEDDTAGAERNVAGMLAEQLAMGVLKTQKNTPAWLCFGMGAYFAAGLDPRSGYVHRLRRTAAAEYQQGWTARANDALGGQLKGDELRAIGYAFVDWMSHDPRARGAFPAFVREISDEGGAKLDDVLQGVFGALRQDFLSSAGQWAARYGGGR